MVEERGEEIGEDEGGKMKRTRVQGESTRWGKTRIEKECCLLSENHQEERLEEGMDLNPTQIGSRAREGGTEES